MLGKNMAVFVAFFAAFTVKISLGNPMFNSGKAPFPPACQDERSDCNWISDNHPDASELARYCLTFKDDPAVKMCPKTCGFCEKFSSPTKKPEPRPPASPLLPETRPPLPVNTETPTEKPVTSDITGFEKECLVAHNKLRALHLNTPALKWSAELARDAQVWADSLASQNKFFHDPRLNELGEGENLAWFSPPNRMCDGPDDKDCTHCGEFVQDWYNEIDDYSFSKGEGKTDWSVYLHFTQVVWKDTTEVGMATAVGHNRVVAVARYRKPGNFGSNQDFREKVQPLHP